MKVATFKQFFLLAFTLCTFLLHAQIQKGALYVESGGPNVIVQQIPGKGLAEISLTSTERGDMYVFSAAPKVGYFFTDRFLLGGSLSSFFISSFDIRGFSAGVFGRYYFNASNPRFNLFAGGGGGYSRLSTDFNKQSNVFADINAGLTRMIAPGVGLDFKLGAAVPDLGAFEAVSLSGGASLNLYLNREAKAGRRTATSGFERGSWAVGASLGETNLYLDPDAKGFSIGVQPSLLYFLNRHFSIGGALSLGYAHTKLDGFQKGATATVGVAPAARYYFGEAKHLQWFAGGGFGVQHTSARSEGINGSDTNFDFGIGGGLNVFLTPSVAVELGPDIRYYTNSETTRIGLSLGLQFFVNRGKKQ